MAATQAITSWAACRRARLLPPHPCPAARCCAALWPRARRPSCQRRAARGRPRPCTRAHAAPRVSASPGARHPDHALRRAYVQAPGPGPVPCPCPYPCASPPGHARRRGGADRSALRRPRRRGRGRPPNRRSLPSARRPALRRPVWALPACRARGLGPPHCVPRARGRGPFAGVVLRPRARRAAAMAWPSSRGPRAQVPSGGRIRVRVRVGVAGRRGRRTIQLPPLLLLLRRARASRAPGADTNSWRQRATSKRTEWPSCPAPFTTALSSMTRQPHAAALMYHMNVSGASGLPQAATHLLLLLFLFGLFVLHPRLTLGLLGCRARGRRARQRRRPGQRRRARSGGSLGLRPSRHLLPQQREHRGLAGPWRVAARSPSARRAWPAPSRPSSSRHAETGSLWIRLGHSGVWRVCLQAGVHDAPHWKGVGCGMGQVGGLSRT